MSISVVMAVHTEERLENIRAALESLRRQHLKPQAVIVAVDNNDALASLLEEQFDWVTVVTNRNHRGASATRNRGVEVVETEYTAFLDDDETADPTWLEELTGPFSEPDVVGTGGKYQPMWPTQMPTWFPPEFEWVVGGSYQGLPTVTAPVRNVWSGNMAVRTESFRKVGGFSVDFGKRGTLPQPEDTDLCIRMAAAAQGHWMYVPTATINHVVPPSRATLRFFVSRCFTEGSGKAAMKNRHASESVIDTERKYAWTVLRTAMRRLCSLQWSETLQGLVILLGLTGAASGYILVEFKQITPGTLQSGPTVFSRLTAKARRLRR